MRRREALAAWLREWEIECALAEGVRSECAGPYPAPARAPFCGRRRAVRAGEVRLLRPADSGGYLRYFLVLETPETGPVRAAPFSRFGAPAFPGEWRTGHPAPALGVLCLWNTSELPRTIAERAWPVADFGAERLAAARQAAAAAVELDRDPPPEWSGSVGPPLQHPDDPRWRYLQEEAQVWERIAALEGEENRARPTLVLRDGRALYGPGSETALPQAAEPKPGYASREQKKGGGTRGAGR